MPESGSFATRAAHAGRDPQPQSISRPLTPPLYQNTVYAFERLEDLETYRNPGPGETAYMYYRNGSPTHTALESAVRALEGAEAAVCAASGMAILSAAILSLARAGDHLVADRQAYGGTYTLLSDELPRLGIETVFVDSADISTVERALAARPSALLVEAISNPLLRVADVPALCALGRAAGVPVLVDATFTSPALLRPVEYGATLSWHSVAKYLGGHSAAMGGVAAGEATLVASIRRTIARWGGCQGEMDAWMTLMGIPTLPLRMPAHGRTAAAVAAYLSTHPAVASVIYPGLPSHPRYALAQRLYGDNCGGMLSFDLRGGEDAARRFVAALSLIAFAPSLADVTTTISYPRGTSHYGLPEEVLRELEIGPGLIRFSAGIEDPADVIAELKQALAACS